jgi:CubicO group peptidase (beta-lactamase class C family)
MNLLIKGRSLPQVALVLLLVPPQPAYASGARQKIDFGELGKVALAEMKEKSTPGAAIAIVSGDRVIYAKGFGIASVEAGGAITPETLFRLGSTTKMFTAAAVVTLAERGKIKLDAPIGGYVKGLSPKLSEVTAHHLISNTSGMRDFAAPSVSQDEAALGVMARSWKDDVFFAEPGNIYSYSSPGFWLAGLLIEEVGGKPYADMMSELLFSELGMGRTTLRPLMAMTYPLALGHNAAPGKPPVIIRPAFNNTAMWPAGSIFSSAADLSRFVIAFMNGGRLEGRQALAPSVVAKLPVPHALMPNDAEAGYGYGQMMFNYRGVRTVMHGGFSRGYGSMIQMVPEHRFAVIVLTNRSGETLRRTTEKALELALPLKPAEPEAPAPVQALGAGEAANYVGTYSHAPMIWEIFERDGKLFLRQGGTESALTRVGAHRFSYGASGEGEIVLVPGADGKAQYLFTGLYSAKKVERHKQPGK